MAMIPNNLKVGNCSSYCDTPSERNIPRLVDVKVGCLHINPASKRGQRIFMLQMLCLCFLPHAALIAQNCSIISQLSQTLESSLYLSYQMDSTLNLGELVIKIQQERRTVVNFLLRNSSQALSNLTTIHEAFIATDEEAAFKLGRALDNSIYLVSFLTSPRTVRGATAASRCGAAPHRRAASGAAPQTWVCALRERKAKAFENITVYEQYNSVMLLLIMKNAKSTVPSLIRLLSLCYDVLKSMEELSLSLAYFLYFQASRLDIWAIVKFESHELSGKEHLMSTLQTLELEKLLTEADTVRYIAAVFERPPLKWNRTENEITPEMSQYRNYVVLMDSSLEKLKEIQKTIGKLVRQKVHDEVWSARQTMIIGVSILTVVLLAAPGLIFLLRHTVQTLQIFNESVEHSNQQLIVEKQKSDLLLSRMLPLPVLQRLRAQRTVPAESFDAVTIFFSDIVGFTNISATSTPMEVINMLNMLYRLFDEKIMQYNVYKVETIGDAYMVVSGLPQRNGNQHAAEIADMSLALMGSLQGARVPHRPDEPLRIRAGVNTGPCVAGVVGTTMPRYCLFGDTINTASRMESTGEAMKIHISSSTKAALDEIGNYEVEYRGKMDVPGKGSMETYWLTGKIGELLSDSPRCLKFQDYDTNLLELMIRS